MKRAYQAAEFLPAIKEIAKEPLTKELLLHPRFLLDKEKELEIYYAPFDYVNDGAQIIIVGITPGWTQMRLSYEAVIRALENGESLEDGVKHVKQHASFAGSMRTHLTSMLDELGLPAYLGIQTTASLFGEDKALLHPCSILRYPVFISQKNYTGHNPLMIRSDLLMNWITAIFLPELRSIHPTLVIPLGKAVSDTLLAMSKEHAIDEQSCLFGFPHPSGANGHRHKQFQEGKAEFSAKIHRSFSK